MVIETARLRLVPLVPGHAGALHALAADWEIVRMLARMPWPLALSDVEAYAAGHERPERESDEFVLLAGGEAVGVAGVKRPGSGAPPRIMPRLGYWIGRAHQGRGYATEAVAAITLWAFGRFRAERVGAGVFHDNAASLRVLEKLGFREVRRYETASLARGGPVSTIDMNFTRAAFEEARR
ncbi:GNAT family N-acetyltransferase [Propylenella binzhouense]|uniref:GNAT family N-acetyltransferase n=1 Tax=Propylenella binzhouense TaxID=2555902 RepID=UPI00136BFD77